MQLCPHLALSTFLISQAVQALEQFAAVVETKLIKHKKEIVSE